MSVAVEEAPSETDPLTAWLDGVAAGLTDAVTACARLRDAAEVSDAERIDRIARLEAIKASAAALQMAESVRFAQSQVAQQLAAEVDPRVAGRGIGDQLGLACKVSGYEGSRRLGIARALWFDLPATYWLLASGQVSERVASLVVAETRHLEPVARRTVDSEVVAAGLARMGVREAAACARKRAYVADPQGYVHRGKTERQHRCVTLRPAPDTMSFLTGYLPVEQGVACLAALRQHTDRLRAEGDPRSRGQIMADTLVERVTGQATATDVNIEVGLLMPLASLLDPTDHTPAALVGHGPIPAALARDILTTNQGRRWWRRLFTAPSDGVLGDGCKASGAQLAPTSGGRAGRGGKQQHDATRGPIVAGDRFRRRFDGWLAELIKLRDQHCRDPYCDAPIRHLDHVRRHASGGPTSLGNGRGVCERGNYVREMPGWTVHVIDDGLRGHPHTIMITTPTGHSYTSTAPQPP